MDATFQQLTTFADEDIARDRSTGFEGFAANRSLIIEFLSFLVLDEESILVNVKAKTRHCDS